MRFHRTTISILSAFLGLLVAVPALAQYGGGGMGGGAGSPGGNGVYTPPKDGYSSSAGIAIGPARRRRRPSATWRCAAAVLLSAVYSRQRLASNY